MRRQDVLQGRFFSYGSLEERIPANYLLRPIRKLIGGVPAADGGTRLQPAPSLLVGVGLDEPIWDVTVFTKNRERFIDGEVARRLLPES